VSWKAIDRKTVAEQDLGPGLSEAAREKIRTFFPRYPTRQAALQAMRDIAAVLEVPPSAVQDVVTFYTHFWTHPRGEKVITVCRSLSCELMGGKQVLAALKAKLGIDEHETTPDGKYSLVTEECLALCDHGPCLLINEKAHKCVRVEDLDQILSDPDNDKVAMSRSELFDAPRKA